MYKIQFPGFKKICILKCLKISFASLTTTRLIIRANLKTIIKQFIFLEIKHSLI